MNSGLSLFGTGGFKWEVNWKWEAPDVTSGGVTPSATQTRWLSSAKNEQAAHRLLSASSEFSRWHSVCHISPCRRQPQGLDENDL